MRLKYFLVKKVSICLIFFYFLWSNIRWYFYPAVVIRWRFYQPHSTILYTCTAIDLGSQRVTHIISHLKYRRTRVSHYWQYHTRTRIWTCWRLGESFRRCNLHAKLNISLLLDTSLLWALLPSGCHNFISSMVDPPTCFHDCIHYYTHCQSRNNFRNSPLTGATKLPPQEWIKRRLLPIHIMPTEEVWSCSDN